MRTHRYDSRSEAEELYIRKHFSMTCEALGDPIILTPVTNITYTNQNEPIYTRSSPIEGYALIQATFNLKYLVDHEWMQEDDEFKPILVNIPFVFDYEPEVPVLVDLANEGHLIRIDPGGKSLHDEVWIATQSRYSDDMTHWILSVVPYRANERDTVPIPTTGLNQNYQFLKG